MSLNSSAPFVGGIKLKAGTPLLSCDGSSLKVVYFLFGLPVSASVILSQYLISRSLKTRTRFLLICFVGQGETSYPLVIWLQAPRQKSVVVVFLFILAQADWEVSSFNCEKGEVNLIYFNK